MKRIDIFLADGFEEIEGLTVVDLLRRAGLAIETVSITGKSMIQGSHNIEVKADRLFEEVETFDADMLVLPGGMPGTLTLQNHKGLEKLLIKYNEEERYLAAICAAPSIFGALGFLEGRRACSYPSMEDKLTNALTVREPVVMDGHIITSRGVGTAIPFALKLISVLCGEKKAEEVRESIVFA